jgi:hypothetical protein
MKHLRALQELSSTEAGKPARKTAKLSAVNILSQIRPKYLKIKKLNQTKPNNKTKISSKLT